MTCPSFRGRTLTCDLPGAPVLARHAGLRLEACRVRGPAVALGSGRHKTRRIRTLRGMGGGGITPLAHAAASDFGSDAWTQG